MDYNTGDTTQEQQEELKQDFEESKQEGQPLQNESAGDDYEEIKIIAVDEPEDVLNQGHVPHYSDQGDFEKIFAEDEA